MLCHILHNSNIIFLCNFTFNTEEAASKSPVVYVVVGGSIGIVVLVIILVVLIFLMLKQRYGSCFPKIEHFKSYINIKAFNGILKTTKKFTGKIR